MQCMIQMLQHIYCIYGHMQYVYTQSKRLNPVYISMNNILYIYTFLCLNRYKNRVYRELGEQRESLSLEKREEAEPLRGVGGRGS